MMAEINKTASHKSDPLLSDSEREEKKADPAEDRTGLPIDRGWAWVIAFSAFMNLTITVGYNRSLSVLFVDIGQAFQEQNKVISLMFTLHAVTGSITSILISNIIMNKFNVRTITVVSSFINALVSVFISLAPNIVVFLGLFLIKGLSFGGLLVCPMSLIGYYFKRRRALASALANAGFCVGYIIFPPFTELLRLHYGYRGTLLIISGIEFHLIAVNLLLRPVESYKTANISVDNEEIQKDPIYKIDKVQLGEIHLSATENVSEAANVNYHKQTNQNGVIINSEESVSVITEGNIGSFNNRDRHKHDDGKANGELSDDDSKSNTNSTLNRQNIQNNSIEDHLKDDSSWHDSHKLLPASGTIIPPNEPKSFYSSQLSIVSNGDIPCVIATKVVKENEKESKKSSCVITSFFDFTLFKSWLFRMMVVFTGLGVFTNYLSIYMPIIAFTSGIDKSDAAMLMMVSGVMDLLTRIVTGFIGDFKWVSKTKMVAFSLFVISIVCHCSRFFNTYPLFVLFAVLVGTFGGFRQNFSNALLLEYFGADNLAKANGLTITIATFILSINHPVLGAMLDSTGSFVIPLHYVGTMVFLANIVILTENFAKRQDEKKNSEIKEKSINKA
ncbi:hypothetical protein Btru_061716 [Bulinus truncatus]|nr:hypothetical protein Btru_061716 [Bulinus truncatus]